MPPRKNADKTASSAQTSQEKVKRTPKRPEKPKLKIPTIIKSRFPTRKSSPSKTMKSPAPPSSGVVPVSPRKTIKSPSSYGVSLKLSRLSNCKMDRANEVALAQLVKPTEMLQSDHITFEPEPIKKRGRPKKCKATAAMTTEIMKTEIVTTKQVKKKRTPKKVKKDSVKSLEGVETTNKDTMETDIDTSEKGVKKKRAPKKVKPRIGSVKGLNSIEALIKDPKWHAPQKKEVKKRQYRRKIVNPNNPVNVTNKRKADSTSKESSKALKQNATVTLTSAAPLRKTRGRKLLEVTSTNRSPSILERWQDQQNRSDTEPTQTVAITPNPIDSRKTSINSTLENMSWTKDISSSSTTTTCLSVCSNDFYRIDKKMPVLKLPNIDSEIENRNKILQEKEYLENSRQPDDESDDSDSSSTSSSSSSSSSDSSSFSSDRTSRSLNLSSNTNSPVKSDILSGRNSNSQNHDLNALLLQYDLKFIDWIGCGDESLEQEETQDKIYDILHEESEIISICKQLKQILKDCVNFDRSVHEKFSEESQTATFAKPVDMNILNKFKDVDFVPSDSRNVILDQAWDRVSLTQTPNDNTEENNVATDEVRYTSFENYDDDDAISLFAESLTGMESSRFNSSDLPLCVEFSEPDHEEYIPKPLGNIQLKEKVYYNPTKIDNSLIQKTTVCEKQNADSTSINRFEKDKEMANPMKKNDKTSRDASTDINVNHNMMPPPAQNKRKALLLSSTYQSTPPVKSVIFKGVCFFNLISNCKKTRCIFPHKTISVTDMSNRLSRVTGDCLIKEYMLMRDWPQIRRMYGIYFVKEAQIKNLTRVLIEMAIDFTTKAKADSQEDADLKVAVNEIVLMHLNSTNLKAVEDLLQYLCISTKEMLCDVLMRTIAETQNFSRFKIIFVKLTNFIVEMGKKFHIDVANQILERVCILPPEEALTSALLKIILNTDASIYSNAMINMFEEHLLHFSKENYDTFSQLKRQANDNQQLQHGLAIVQTLPDASNQIEGIGKSINRPDSHNDQLNNQPDRESYTSPDTTKLDLNKPIEEPIINRTLNFLHHNLYQSQSPEFRPNFKHRPWRRNPHSNFIEPLMPYGCQIRPLLRPPHPMKRRIDQRYVTYGSTPQKFPRRFNFL